MTALRAQQARLPLAELLRALRVQGFPIGVDDHVRVARILSMDGAWDIDKVRHALRAVLATDMHSRAIFDRVYDEFLATTGRDSLDEALSSGTDDAPASVSDGSSGDRTSVTRAGGGAGFGVATVAIVAVVAAVVTVVALTAKGRSVIDSGDGVTGLPSFGQPAVSRAANGSRSAGTEPLGVEPARIDKAAPGENASPSGEKTRVPTVGTRPVTAVDGERGPGQRPSSTNRAPGPQQNSLDERRRNEQPVDERLRDGADGIDPNDRAISGNMMSNTNAGATSASADDPAGLNAAAPDLNPIEANAGVVDATSRDWAVVAMWSLLCGGIAAVFAALVLGWRVRRRRRRFVPGPWRYQRVIPPEQLGAAFTEAQIEDTAATLTWQAGFETTDVLDIDRTIARTVDTAGFVRPVYKPPPPAPEYAVLIDGSPSASGWRPMYEELFDRLQAQGVRLRRYAYRDAPDMCTAADGRRDETLAELSEHYDAIIVVGDGRMALDPFSRAPARWVDALQHFPHRMWLNPLPRSRWSESAHAIAHATPMVHGAGSMLGALRPGVSLEPDAVHPYPAVIDMAPDSDLALGALHAYLGDTGFRTLQLCAVVGDPSPVTARWLAHRMGFALTESEQLRLFSLAMLARGRWPTNDADGLVNRLVASVREQAPEQAQRARELVLELVHANEPTSGSMAHMRWQLDRAVVRAARGDDESAAINRLLLSPIHADAAWELGRLGLRDRVSLGIKAFAVVGVIALSLGAVFGRAVRDRDRARTLAAQRHAVHASHAAWMASKVCMYGTETPLERSSDALAYRLVTDTRADWARCTPGVVRARDIRPAPEPVGWPAVTAALARTRDALSAEVAIDGVDMLASALSEADRAYDRARRALEMAPMPPLDTVTLGQTTGRVIEVADGQAIVPTDVVNSDGAMVMRGTSARGREIAVIRGRDDIAVYPEPSGILRAMEGADWGVQSGDGLEVRAGRLDARGQLVDSVLLGQRLRRAKVQSKRQTNIQTRGLEPAYALGLDEARLVVIEDTVNRAKFAFNSYDYGRNWLGMAISPEDLHLVPSWTTGRLLLLWRYPRGLSWHVYEQSDLFVSPITGIHNDEQMSDFKTACFGCRFVWSVHERGLYRLGVSQDQEIVKVAFEPADSMITACDDDRLMLAATSTDTVGERARVEVRVCSIDGCAIRGQLPRQNLADMAIALTDIAGPLIAHVERGVLVLWTAVPGASDMRAQSVLQVDNGTRVVGLEMWGDALFVLLDYGDDAQLTEVPREFLADAVAAREQARDASNVDPDNVDSPADTDRPIGDADEAAEEASDDDAPEPIVPQEDASVDVPSERPGRVRRSARARTCARQTTPDVFEPPSVEQTESPRKNDKRTSRKRKQSKKSRLVEPKQRFTDDTPVQVDKRSKQQPLSPSIEIAPDDGIASPAKEAAQKRQQIEQRVPPNPKKSTPKKREKRLKAPK